MGWSYMPHTWTVMLSRHFSQRLAVQIKSNTASSAHKTPHTGNPTALRLTPPNASSMRSRQAYTGSSASSKCIGLMDLAHMKKLNTVMSVYSGLCPPRNGCLPSICRSGSSAFWNAASFAAFSLSGHTWRGQHQLRGHRHFVDSVDRQVNLPLLHPPAGNAPSFPSFLFHWKHTAWAERFTCMSFSNFTRRPACLMQSIRVVVESHTGQPEV